MFTTCADEGEAVMNNAAATAAPHNNRFMGMSPFRGEPRDAEQPCRAEAKGEGGASRIWTTRDPRRVNGLAAVFVDGVYGSRNAFSQRAPGVAMANSANWRA
jgi:hypothetical protein